jgi:hypothetical protein
MINMTSHIQKITKTHQKESKVLTLMNMTRGISKGIRNYKYIVNKIVQIKQEVRKRNKRMLGENPEITIQRSMIIIENTMTDNIKSIHQREETHTSNINLFIEIGCKEETETIEDQIDTIDMRITRIESIAEKESMTQEEKELGGSIIDIPGQEITYYIKY